jgi:hypothetical protein
MPIGRRTFVVAATLMIAANAAAAAGPAPTVASALPGVGIASAGDAPDPLARIVSPRRGEIVAGVLRPGLHLGDPTGIRRLELRVDGRLVGSWSPLAAHAPRWRTASVANGPHRLELLTVGPHATRRDARRVIVANPVTRARKPAAPAPVPVSAPAAPSAPVVPAAPPSAPPTSGLDIPGVILRTGNFNTGDLSQWSGHQNLRSYSLTTVAAPAREGSYAGRFEVRKGDDPLCAAGWGCYGDRSEVQMGTGETEGQERWYSWSTMVAPDFPRSSAWQVVSQWHANADGSPPIAFFAENDDLVLRFHRTASPGRILNVVDAWRGPLKRGSWQDIRLHVKWSGSDTVGFVELWINGVAQTFDTGGTRRYIRNMYPGIGNYFKQGLYRQAGLAQTGIVYHDGFKMSRP